MVAADVWAVAAEVWVEAVDVRAVEVAAWAAVAGWEPRNSLSIREAGLGAHMRRPQVSKKAVYRMIYDSVAEARSPIGVAYHILMQGRLKGFGGQKGAVLVLRWEPANFLQYGFPGDLRQFIRVFSDGRLCGK